MPGSFCYELTLNGHYSARFNYGNGRDRYYIDPDQYHPDVVNKVLYGHRTITESELKKIVVTPDKRTSVN